MPPPPAPTSTQQGAPIVVKADGLAAGKGVVVAPECRRGACGHRRDARRPRAGHRRRARGRRGLSRGRGGELHRHGRRAARAAARLVPGSQAVARRRPGPEYRRHGRLFAGAGRHAGHARAHHARGDPADGQRHGRRRHPLRRIPLCRRDDRRRRQSESAGIQLPAGRSRNPADHGQAEVRSRRSRRAWRQWYARPRGSRMGSPRGVGSRARGARLSRQPGARATSSRVSTA